MYRIRRSDLIQVATGKDKGKKGRVLCVFSESNKAIVEGVNLVKKHQRKTQQDQQGGLREIPAPLDISNLILICKNCNKPSKVKFMLLKNGVKSRACKKCKEPI